ncbi:DNA-binding response regulator, LytR/AlgR family [Flexibacter flexilis DSM 6793]|uniref:DNA-binding response regulator, LytR/AlgR family n=1 Tax=Flexibacter flexilis DSM 6793 TaxID=927664 RepID=A0A1I1DNK4_9BACT|nr:LytTR family DNA-binding domain-containing protein [Flexibacter flexilis]SFB76427.1 DNA-binding response regulator, LytR/AlgR family [Flexibacter flexilis DSM 6793]
MKTNKTYSCVLIDDDAGSRLILEHYIKLNPQLDLRASLGDGAEGLRYLLEHQDTDILFLDIQMPQMTGIELLKVLPKMPETILITSQTDFAIDAYALNVTDYLVKPPEYARFCKAVEKILDKLAYNAQKNAAQNPTNNEENSKDIFVKVSNKMIKIDLETVLYVEALSDYVLIATENAKHVVYSTLKAVSDRLPSSSFMRIHRSYIVNLKKIRAVEDNSVLIENKLIPISKSYQTEFYNHLNTL